MHMQIRKTANYKFLTNFFNLFVLKQALTDYGIVLLLGDDLSIKVSVYFSWLIKS